MNGCTTVTIAVSDNYLIKESLCGMIYIEMDYAIITFTKENFLEFSVELDDWIEKHSASEKRKDFIFGKCGIQILIPGRRIPEFQDIINRGSEHLVPLIKFTKEISETLNKSKGRE